MSVRLRYFFIQLKRAFIFLPGILSMIVAITWIIGVGVYSYISSQDYSKKQQKIQIGIIRDADDGIISLGIQMLQSIDDTKYMLDIVEFDSKDEALDKLHAGEISAFVELTPEFVAALDHMENDISADYYAISGANGINGAIMDEISGVVSKIIVYSDAGILSMRQYMRGMGYSSKQISKATQEILLAHINGLLSRDGLLKVKKIGVSSGLTASVYYFSAIVLFLILMLTMSQLTFINGDNIGLIKFLHSKGVNPLSQVVLEYLAMLLINLIVTGAICVIIFVAEKYSKISLKELHINVESAFFLWKSLVPVVMLFSAVSFIFFEVFTDNISRGLVTFFAYIGMCYMSGYFYPKSFFPDSFVEIGSWLPTGRAFDYFGKCMSEGSSATLFWGMIIYGIAFLLVAGVVRYKKSV